MKASLSRSSPPVQPPQFAGMMKKTRRRRGGKSQLSHKLKQKIDQVGSYCATGGPRPRAAQATAQGAQSSAQAALSCPDLNSDSDVPRGPRACCSDSEGSPSKLVQYNSEVVEGFTKDGLKGFESVYRIRKSIVLLAATAEGNDRFYSGTVVDNVGPRTWILTSASLVRKPGSHYEAFDQSAIKIKVVLDNEQTIEGSLEMCNLHYNIAIVTFSSSEAQINLPVVGLSDLPECYSLHPRPVVALGRDVESRAFLMRYGFMVRKSSELDCKELLVCTCDVTQDFVGGPVMDSEGRFLGITFTYRKTALFLPVEIAARCLEYYQNSKNTLPCLRIRGQALHTLDLDVLENIRCKFSGSSSGILVNKICDMFKESYGGIEAGDIITLLDGVIIYSAAQFTVMLLDKLVAVMGTPNTLILQAVVQRPKDKTTFVAKLNLKDIATDECDKSFQNRWLWWKPVECPNYQ